MNLIETIVANTKPENESKQENESLYNTPVAQPDTKLSAASTAIQPTAQPAPSIVDKSSELTQIHPLKHAQDKLTALADLDEEKFIEEVESAHGHK